MDGGFWASAERVLGQDQDLAYAVKTAVGDFTLVSFKGREAVNQPFEIDLELASFDADIDLHALLDTQACIAVCSKYAPVKYLNGVVCQVTRGDEGARRCQYTMTLRPALHRLSLMTDARIWQQMTPQAIAAEILSECGIPNVEWRLNEEYAKREYVTMLDEDYLSFIQRLLNEVGIFYYFSHHEDHHRLIFTDAPLATPVLPEAEEITYNAKPGGQSRGFWITGFSQKETLSSTGYELNDYWFKNPASSYNQHWARQEDNGSAGQYPLYEFPGRYKEPRQSGRQIVRSRMEAARVDATTGDGMTNHPHLMPGFHFSITDHDDEKANIQHFILTVQHAGKQPTALEEDAPDAAPTTYEAAFTTMPGRLPYRPEAPDKPTADGPMVAMVTGPEGEEIYTDEFGRVKCHFYFDRRSQKDEYSSCWIRVSQNWAGGAWGHMAVPRIGQEVLVAHIDGDIDQPIVIGRFYHASNRPPYALPANKTVMTIKSQTHKGEGYNELRFEDERDREEVFMHAQKDHNTVIQNDETHRIGHNRAKSVGNDQSESIGNDKTISVGNDHTETIGRDARHTIRNDVFYHVERTQHERYGKDRIEHVGNILKQDVDGDHLEVVGRNYDGTVKGRMELVVGSSITTNAGQVHELMAGQKFEIKGPGGKITIDASGITLEAPRIDLRGQVSMGGSGGAQVPALDLRANDVAPICEECAQETMGG